MNNIAFLGRVAEHVSRSAVSRAARVASTFGGHTTNDVPEETVPLASDLTVAGDGSEAAWGDVVGPELEMADTPQDTRDVVITEDEFQKLLAKLNRNVLPQRGDSDAARSTWTVPRRFSVKLRNFIIESLGAANYESVFLIITVGGTQTEVRVKDPYTKASTPKVAGYPGDVFITPAVELRAHIPVDIPFEKSLEWRGSYLHLEKEHFGIELWEGHGTALNTLLSYQEEPLRNFVEASVTRTTTLDDISEIKRKLMGGAVSKTFRISFQIEFQEIYDYELNFCNLKLLKRIQEIKTDTGDLKFQESSSKLLLEAITQSSFANDTENGILPMKSLINFENVETGLSKEQLRQLFQSYEGYPIIRILIRASGHNKWPLKLSSPPCKDPLIDFWQFNGSVIFRGTASDIETTDVIVEICDSTRPDNNGKKRLKSIVNLADAIDTSHLAFHFESNHDIISSAVMTCGIPFKPKYRQTGHILDIDNKQLYLFVKLLKIDRLRPQPDTDEIDSFVEVMYDGHIKHSTTVFASISPHYQSELVFGIKVSDINNIKPADLESKGPILLDVWGSADIGSQHLGWTEIHLSEILHTADGTTLPLQTRRYFDRRQSKEASYDTRILSTKKRLCLPWDTGREFTSNILLEVWTKPDLGNISLKLPTEKESASCFSPDIKAKISKDVLEWQLNLSKLAYSTRQMGCLALDQRGRLLPYNLFVFPIPPFPEISTTYDCLNLVRSISFSDPPEDPYQWFSPDFIIKAKRGAPFHHALLLAGLFMGIKIPCFVCLGTLENDRQVAWVLTLQAASSKKDSLLKLHLWDPVENIIYLLPDSALGGSVNNIVGDWIEADLDHLTHPNERDEYRRRSVIATPLKDNISFDVMRKEYGIAAGASMQFPVGKHSSCIRQRKKITSCPLKSIDVVFNHKNVYANLQFASLQDIRFNLANERHWRGLFSSSKLEIDPVFPRNFATSAPDVSITSFMTKSLYEEIMKSIQSLRFHMSMTASTAWVNQGSLKSFLENGMHLVSELDRHEPGTTEASKLGTDFQNWRVALLSLTPDFHKLRWMHITFNHANTKLITQHMWNTVKFLKENDRTLRFALGIYIRPMPCDLVLTYVAIIGISKLRKIEQRQMIHLDAIQDKEETGLTLFS